MNQPRKTDASIDQFVAAVRAPAVAAEVLLRDDQLHEQRKRLYVRVAAEIRFLAHHVTHMETLIHARPMYDNLEQEYYREHGYPPNLY